MISLVVCSINPSYLNALQRNVEEFIGVEHEWLVYDNRNSSLGICAVYNMMASKAQYPYICFLHEDIIIETKDWGQLLIEMSEHKQAELIGVAGGQYKSSMFSGWYSDVIGLNYYNVYHRHKDRDELMYGPEVWPAPEMQVATIDGVFMFAKRQVWEDVKFNEQLLKGFHYYDIDFSLRAANFYKVFVTRQIKIIHLSTIGDFGNPWVESAIHWHQNMKPKLPFSVAAKVPANIEIIVARYWLDHLKNFDVSWANKQKWIALQQLYKFPNLWYSILKFLLYKPLGLKSIHMFVKHKKWKRK